jgi:hydrogenase expression/formation protein HypD
MKYVDEYRDPQLAASLVAKIRSVATRRWTLMEVCGGQTHGLLRHGIDEALQDVVEMLHGPGCPVCVTPIESIEKAIELARQPQTILASFGDMLRVPGATGSLLKAKSQGADVRVVYSPLDAVEIAKKNPNAHVVFFAVGFETTAPATGLAVLQSQRLGLENFSLLSAHVRVEPAMQSIAQSPECRIQGFLAAGHVCTVMGYDCYQEFSRKYRLPVVVTGFEPIDLLSGIYECVRQLENGQCEVANEYARSVRSEGNVNAQSIIAQVFEIADRPWRGLGVIPQGGLVLRDEFKQFDADSRFPKMSAQFAEPTECHSGEVMTGRIRPPQCPQFGLACTPQNPLGAPMVSSEGACAAYYAYQSRPRVAEVGAEP